MLLYLSTYDSGNDAADRISLPWKTMIAARKAARVTRIGAGSVQIPLPLKGFLNNLLTPLRRIHYRNLLSSANDRPHEALSRTQS